MTKIKKGDVVSWICKPFGGVKFKAKGVVEDIHLSTLGSHKRAVVASILVYSRRYLKEYSGRKHTTVGIDKLTVI